ncbi:MAG TPA: hypothetical protein DCY94_03940 [Firmicutes bacterium]|nr:hypothetical protein [Bacillota bacterium]
MNNDSKNRRLVIAIMLVTVVLITIGGTFAYFLTTAGRNEEQKLTIKTGNLALTFEDNDDGLNERIMIGESVEKLFIIRNTGTQPVTTNMIWDGLVNTYLEESLSYTLEYKTTEDGTYQSLNTAHTNVPQSDRADDFNLAKNITIPSKGIYYYRLTITFNNLNDVNQEADRTAILNTKFNLGEAIDETITSDKVLAHLKLTAKEGNPTFANVATTDEGVYSIDDDYGKSYYFRGAVSNNYVKFGGFFWRIIRINGDGSIRMQYDGTQAYANANGGNGSGGADRYTHTGKAWNAISNDAKYVGWMFGGDDGVPSEKKDVEVSDTTEEAKGKAATYNQTDSDIKELWVDPWYKTNIEDKNLGKYVSDEIFCNDRSMGRSYSTYTNKGFGTTPTNYAAGTRFLSSDPGYTDATPTFKCPQKNDAFTKEDTTKGNGFLKYPIGLITADEIVAAGSGKYGFANKYYYLYKNNSYQYYRSLTAYRYSGAAEMFMVYSDGNLAYAGVSGDGAIAPVINIAPEYAKTMVGEGSMTKPYQIPSVE